MHRIVALEAIPPATVNAPPLEGSTESDLHSEEMPPFTFRAPVVALVLLVEPFTNKEVHLNVLPIATPPATVNPPPLETSVESVGQLEAIPPCATMQPVEEDVEGVRLETEREFVVQFVRKTLSVGILSILTN